MSREAFNPDQIRNRIEAEERREREPELSQLTEQVIGAALEVHRVPGPGRTESVYEAALCVEPTLRGVPSARQTAVELEYKGHRVGQGRPAPRDGIKRIISSGSLRPPRALRLCG